MLNLKQVQQISKGCGFKHRLLSQSSKPKAEVVPREASLDKVRVLVKAHKGITRKVILDKSDMSPPCLDRCMVVLLGYGEIKGESIGYSGPHEIFVYTWAGK